MTSRHKFAKCFVACLIGQFTKSRATYRSANPRRKLSEEGHHMMVKLSLHTPCSKK